MNTAKLSEVAVLLIRNKLQQDLPAELLSIQQDRGNYDVTLPNPAEYFISEKKKILNLPALFILTDRIDFQLNVGQNHPNALLYMNLTCVNEDRNTDFVTIQTYRYQAALYSVLSGAQLTDATNNMTLVIKVMQANYSPIYSADDQKTTAGVFRKEVSLALEINLFENLS